MELEIKVMWCRGITAFNFFQKLTLYTSVSIKSEDQRIQLTETQKQEQKTHVDEQGEENPEWNYTMKFNLGSSMMSSRLDLFSLHFEVKHHGQLFGDKTVGEVCVPLRELVDSVGVGVVRFAKYEVRSPDGKPNGVLDFSYKVENGERLDLGHHQHQHHDHDHDHHHDYSHGSEIHITGYNQSHHDNSDDHRDHYHHYVVDQPHSLDGEKIEYPKIDMEEELGGNVPPSAPPLEGGYYPPPSSATGYYPPPNYRPPSYPPPGRPMWGPPPPPPVVYPPPQPYEDPHWAYPHRLPPPPPPPRPNYHHQSSGGYGSFHW